MAEDATATRHMRLNMIVKGLDRVSEGLLDDGRVIDCKYIVIDIG